MIRVVVRTDEGNMAAHVGGFDRVTMRTFDIENPELEAFLTEEDDNCCHRQIVGVEVIAAKAEEAGS